MTDSTEPDAAACFADPSPFDLPGSGGAAALCLHGLTGTPYEVRPLAEAIARTGVRALGPVLPGHNATPEQLADVPYTAWLDCARDHFHRLRAEYDRVFVVGLSMGGLLALALAAEERVDALVTVGTPLKLHHPLAWLIPLIRYIQPLPRKRVGSDIRERAARLRHPSYDRMPLKSVCELQRLQRWVRPRLAQVTAPILVAHGAYDRTASPADAATIRDSVSSQVCEYILLASSAHIVPVDADGPALAGAVADFLVQHT